MPALNAAPSVDAVTVKVVAWMLSRRVLARRLRMIAMDPVAGLGGEQELACTVTDLLDPGQDGRWAAILAALGVGRGEADAVWAELEAESPSWMNHVDWGLAMRALVELES